MGAEYQLDVGLVCLNVLLCPDSGTKRVGKLLSNRLHQLTNHQISTLSPSVPLSLSASSLYFWSFLHLSLTAQPLSARGGCQTKLKQPNCAVPCSVFFRLLLLLVKADTEHISSLLCVCVLVCISGAAGGHHLLLFQWGGKTG